jgi:hypothetical protein
MVLRTAWFCEVVSKVRFTVIARSVRPKQSRKEWKMENEIAN